MGLTKSWKGRRRSRSFESKKSKKPPEKKKLPQKEKEQESQSTCNSSLPLDNIDASADDVSSIHVGESVTGSPAYVPQSISRRSPLNHLLPPLFPPSHMSRSIQFVRSDSYLNPEFEEKSQAIRSTATPAIDNTSQPSPALTSLVYLSLICLKAVEGSQVVHESLQRHVFSALESQPTRSASSIPVDLDDGLFVGDDVSVIDDMALRNVSMGNVKGAIDILSTLLSSQRAKHHDSTVQELYSQLSVLHVLDGDPRMALYCSQRSEKSVSGLMQVGMMHLFSSCSQQALDCWRQALQLQCKLGGYHHLYIPLLLNNMACIHYLEHQNDVALALLEESLALQREHHAADVSGLEHMATSLLNLGVVNEQLGQYEKATCLVEEGLMVMESVVPEDDSYVTCCRNTLQRLLFLRGSRRDESPKSTTKTMPVFGYSDGIPMRQGTHSVDTICMGSLKTELTVEGRVHKAVVASMRLEGVVASSFVSVPVDLDGDYVVDAELHLSGIHTQVMRHLQREEVDEALELLRLACKSHKLKYGNVHHLVGTALHNIALVNLYAGRYKDALWYFQEAVSVRVAALGTNHPDVSASMLKLGLIQMANGDLDTAYVTFTQVLHTRRKVIGCNQPEVAKILNLIGYLQYEFGSLLAALKSMEEALEILRPEEKDAADTLANVGFLYFKLEDYKEAIAVYQEALYIQKRLLGDLHPKTVVTRENLEYVRQQSSHSLVFKMVEPCVESSMMNCNSFESITARWHD